MPLQLAVPLTGGESLNVPVSSGAATFIVGANGTGKSALMVKFKIALQDRATRIVAARPLALQSDAPEIPAAQAINNRRNINSWDSQVEFRAKLPGLDQRAQLYLQSLSEMEGAFHRSRSASLESVHLNQSAEDPGRELAITKILEIQALRSPLSRINRALDVSGFLIQLHLSDDGEVKATKHGSGEYGVSQTSDGERAALILLIEILSAPANQILLIDEPERHIHRSLLHPLLQELIKLRPDCSFVITTHDIDFVSQFKAPVVLLRKMVAIDKEWVADLVPDSSLIDGEIREDILGSRRRILFVEGKREGIDDRLYNLLFEDVSVVSKGASRNVLDATRAANKLEETAWLRAWGVIDSDGRTAEEIDALRRKSVWPIPVYSIESVYYHPLIIERLITAGETPNSSVGLDEVLECAVRAIEPDLDRLAGRSVEKSVRHAVMTSIPSWDRYAETVEISPEVSPKALYEAELRHLSQRAASRDWASLVARCPIRESQAPEKIAKLLGFSDKRLYEDAMRECVANDVEMRQKIQDVLGAPIEGLTYKVA